MSQLINITDLGKESQYEIVKSVVELVENGQMGGLEVNLRAKAIIKIMQGIVSGTSTEALKDADKYGRGQHLFMNAEFSIVNTPTTYDFESDQEYKDLNNKLKQRKALLTSAAKGKESGKQIIQDDEIIQPPKIKSHGGETIKVVFK